MQPPHFLSHCMDRMCRSSCRGLAVGAGGGAGIGGGGGGGSHPFSVRKWRLLWLCSAGRATIGRRPVCSCGSCRRCSLGYGSGGRRRCVRRSRPATRASQGAQSLRADHAEAGRGKHEAREAHGPVNDGVKPPRRREAEQRLPHMHTLPCTGEACDMRRMHICVNRIATYCCAY